jgi:hypothetical protein
MNKKNIFSFHFSFSMTLIFFMIIFAILRVVSSLSLNINHIAIAKQQQQQPPKQQLLQQVNIAESNNQTLSLDKQQ